MDKKTVFTGILAALTVVGGIWFTLIRKSSSTDTPTPPVSSETDKNSDDKSGTSDKNDKETPENKDETGKDKIENSEHNPDTSPNEDEFKPDSDISYEGKGTISEVISKYLATIPTLGGYDSTGEDGWTLIDFGEIYGEMDKKFNNLYSFSTNAYFTEETKIPVPASSLFIEYMPYDEVPITGYVTYKNGVTTIHRIDIGGNLAIEDGYVDESMYSILHENIENVQLEN